MRRSLFTPTRVVLLFAIAVLLVAEGLLLAPAAMGSDGLRGSVRAVVNVLAFLAAAIALRGAWLFSRELQRGRDAEERLRASEAKFAGILAIAVDAIITVDEHQQILHFNHGAELLFGYAERDMIGGALSQLLPSRYRDAHQRHLLEFGRAEQVSRRMGERRPVFGLRRDGTEFPAEASISRLDLPGTRVFTVVLRDISERLRAEENQRFLARSGGVLATSLDYESTLRSVVHLPIPHLADCCVLHIVDGGSQVRTLVSVHEDPERTKRLRALERGRADASNWPFPVASVLADRRYAVRRHLAAGWSLDGGEGDVRANDLEALGIHACATLPLVARTQALGTLTLLSTDPTRLYGDVELALAEDLALRAAFAVENARLYQSAQQASRARDEILGVVSHDLRNPLSAISMCARVLHESPPAKTDERRELTGAILESTQLMQRLIQDLLDVSTIESGHLTMLPRHERLAPIVESVMQMVRAEATARDVGLDALIPATLPTVHVDAMRLEQALANLLGNAIKFSERGSRVSVRAEVALGGVRVAVVDRGAGIPAEHLPHIFDRYWHARRQSRTAGTGLGLAIARGIVHAHGGVIEVESTLGVGSTFTVTLPTSDDALALELSDGASANVT